MNKEQLNEQAHDDHINNQVNDRTIDVGDDDHVREVYIGNKPNVINVGDEDSPKWLEVPDCTADVLNCECSDCKDQYLQDTGIER